MINKKNIINFVNELNPKQRYQKIIDLPFAEMKELTIVRSANMALFRDAVNTLLLENPNLKINVITHKKDVKAIKESYPEINMIPYDKEGLLDSEKLAELLKCLNSNNLVVLYNNSWGSGYSNIDKGLLSLGEKHEIYFFNIHRDFYKIDNLSLKLINEKLLFNIVNWYEEYVKLGEGYENWIGFKNN